MSQEEKIKHSKEQIYLEALLEEIELLELISKHLNYLGSPRYTDIDDRIEELEDIINNYE